MASFAANQIYTQSSLLRAGVKSVSAVEPSVMAEAQYRAGLNRIVEALVKASNPEKLVAQLKKDVTTDASPEDEAAKIIEKIKQQFNPIALMAAKLSDKVFSAAESSSRAEFTNIMRGELGIDVTQMLKQDGVINAMQERISTNVALIKTIPQQYLAKVEELVYKATMERNAVPLQQALMKLNKSTLARAKLIARDQTAKYNTQLTEIRNKNLGITHYIWVTSRDERVRPTHRENDGKIFAWDDPSPITGHPGHDINCRCTAKPVINLAPKGVVETGKPVSTPIVSKVFTNAPDDYRETPHVLNTIKSLSDDQTAALLRYSQSGYDYSYSTMNQYLRNNNTFKHKGMMNDEEMVKRISDIDTAIEKSSTGFDSYLYRGTGGVEYDGVDLDLPNLGLKPGVVIRDKAFTSTSTDLNMVLDGYHYKDSIILRIENKADDPAIVMGQGLGWIQSEKEVLLPRSSSFRVKSIEEKESKTGKKYVEITAERMTTK